MAAGGGKRRKKRSFGLDDQINTYEDTFIKASEKFSEPMHVIE